MENDLKEKLDMLDQQIGVYTDLYQDLTDGESGYKDVWTFSSLQREKEIFDKIHQIQDAKTRLITGETPPEIVYVDRETVRYEDRVVKTVFVHKSSLSTALVFLSLLAYSVLAVTYYLGYFKIVVNLQGSLS